MDLELLALEYERRGLAREIRLDEDTGPPIVRGYAAVFNAETELWPGYREVIRPGAFAKSLASDATPKKALWDHETRSPLASTGGVPPLRLWEDDHGLGFQFEPPETQAGRELVVLLRRKIVDGASFGFRAVDAPEKARNSAGGVVLVREILEAELFEVSPVSFPAYAGTETLLRRLLDLERRALTAPELRSIIDAAPRDLRRQKLPTPRRAELERELERI